MRVEAATRSELCWLVERTQAGLTDAARGIKAMDAGGRVRGMVAYDNWTLNSVQAHMAMDAPIVWRSLLPAVFEYPFSHVGVLLGIIPAGNLASNRMVDSLGFRQVYRVKQGWSPTEDLVLWQMRREECRWLQGYQPRQPGWYREGSPLL